MDKVYILEFLMQKNKVEYFSYVLGLLKIIKHYNKGVPIEHIRLEK